MNIKIYDGSVWRGIFGVIPPITDLTPPNVLMDTPTEGQTFAVGAAVTVHYTLFDAFGVVSHKLYVGGIQVTPTSLGDEAYSYNILSLPAGTTVIKVEAADAAGNLVSLVRTILTQATSSTIDKTVAASGDDWYVGGGSSPFYFGSSTTNYLGWQGSFEHQTGHRYTDVQLEKRQRVTAASASLVAYGYHNGTQTVPGVAGVDPNIVIRIRGVLGKNPANPASLSDQQNSPKTTAFVDWDITEWANGSRYTTPDLSAIVQELVNQSTWAKGDNIVLAFGAATLSGTTAWLREWGFDRGSNPSKGQLHIEASAELVPVSDNRLTWAPPTLTNPTTVSFPSGGVLNLDTTKDYLVNMGSTPHTKALAVNGGRNIVLIGGEINIPTQPNASGSSYPSISSRRGIKFQGQTGVVHFEGVWFHGDDLSEGIQIAAPQAIVQIQNIRIDNIHARDQVNFADNHPDLIQTYGSVKELRVDRFTGSTDYQGFLLQPDNNTGPHGPTIIKRANIIGLPTARYLFWMNNRTGWTTVQLEDFWCDIPPERTLGFGKSVFPDTGATAPNLALVETLAGVQRASWPNMTEPRVSGYVLEGQPPGGDFCPAGVAGLGYVSPGYL